MELSKLSTKCKWGLYYWSLFCPIYIIYLYEVSYTLRPKVTHEEPYHPLVYALLISAAQFVWRVITYCIYWRLDVTYIFFVSSMFEAVAMPVITWTNIILCSLGGPQLIPGSPYASVMSSIIDPDHKYFILDVLFCVMELAWMVTCVWLHYVLWTEDFERKREKFKLPVHCKREDIATSQYQSYRMTDRDEIIKVAFFLMWCYVCLYLPYNLDLENLRRNHSVN